MRKNSVLITMLLLLFLSACQQEKSPYFDVILKTERNDFRGAKIGANIAQVKQLENEQFLLDKAYDYLHYDYEISMGNTYTVTYDFSEADELYEIEAIAFIDDIKEAPLLFKNFNDFYSNKYGEGQVEEDGFITWKKSRNIEIALKNSSVKYGIITIIIRDLDY